jgi:hypothetical protein
MQYQQAVRLGMLHRQLGIPPNARIFLQITTEGTIGAFIWDLDSGNTYLVVYGATPIRGKREVPKKVKDIIAASDDDLKKRWLSTMGWNDERETVFSELNFRGIDILQLERIG